MPQRPLEAPPPAPSTRWVELMLCNLLLSALLAALWVVFVHGIDLRAGPLPPVVGGALFLSLHLAAAALLWRTGRALYQLRLERERTVSSPGGELEPAVQEQPPPLPVAAPTGASTLQDAELARLRAEKVSMEARLRESLESLNRAQRIAGLCSYDWDILADAIHWSDETWRLMGLTPGERPARFDTFIKYVHPDDRPGVHQAFQAILARPHNTSREFRMLRGDGTPFWIHAQIEVVCDAQGRPAKVYGTLHDVDDRKQAEQTLRQREELLRRIFESLPLGLWHLDAAGNLLRANEAGLRLWGGAPYIGRAGVRHFQGWWWETGRAIEPHEWSYLRTLDRGETVLNELIEIEGFDRVRRIIQLSSVPLRDERDAVQGAIVITQDITDRLCHEARLEAAETRFRALVESAPDAMLLVDGQGLIRLANERAEVLFGWDRETLVGQSTEILVPTDRLNAHRESRRHYLSRPAMLTADQAGDRYALRRDGTELPVEVAVNPIETPDGPLVLCIVRDITRRHRLEFEQRFLARCSKLLSSSLEYETTWKQIASLPVPELADWCVLDLIQEDGSIRRTALAHTDPERLPLVRELEAFPPSLSESFAGGEVLRSGRPWIMPGVSALFMRTHARGNRHLELLEKLGATSVLVLPLCARGRTLGALTLVYGHSHRRYETDDIPLLEDLAGRCAVSLDNARLYRALQERGR